MHTHNYYYYALDGGTLFCILPISDLILMKTSISVFTLACTLIVITSTMVIAQPGLPGAPDQAPIDGGLGILAVAGGAYALKKLRDKNKES